MRLPLRSPGLFRSSVNYGSTIRANLSDKERHRAAHPVSCALKIVQPRMSSGRWYFNLRFRNRVAKHLVLPDCKCMNSTPLLELEHQHLTRYCWAGCFSRRELCISASVKMRAQGSSRWGKVRYTVSLSIT